MSDILMLKKTTPSTPASNRVKLFFDTVGNLSSVDELGDIKTYAEGITVEEVQDIVGAMFGASATVVPTYDDSGNIISLEVDQTGIDHTQILNKGTNTHAQIDTHIANTSNPHSTTKAQVGLSNCDNTSDLNKPISTATQTALNSKYDASNPNSYETTTQLNARDTANRSRTNHTGTQLASTISDFSTAADARITAQKGVANGVATLDATVKIPAIQIPALPYAPTSHTHVVADITDFTTGVTTITNPLYATIGHTHANATTVASGFMSAADKVKLDGITNDVFYKTTAALTNSSNVTLTSITQLGIPVVAGTAYRFRIWILYRSSANTTGLVVAMTNTAGATGTLSLNLRNNTSTTAASLSTLNAFNSVLTYTSTPTANTDFIAEIEGIFVCTASGNIVPQFRSETNGQTITVQANSIAEVKQL